MRDWSWILCRPQGRAPQASRAATSPGLRQRLSRARSGEGDSHRPRRRNSARAHTTPVHAPVRPWSPHVLPRRQAANWVGPVRGRKSTRPRANGVVELSPFGFLDRLADLVPPPRRHRHRYHGVFAQSHKSGPPSRHSPSGMTASGPIPRLVGMRSADMRQAEMPMAAAIRVTSPAPMTPRG